MIYRVIIFLILNFGALGIGSLFMGEGPASEWYINLSKAPWTPPGWVFGAAWTTIMICFSFYMASAWKKTANKNSLILLFGIQWILNVSWNPLFFKYHEVLVALIAISALTVVVATLLFKYAPLLKAKTLLMAPYLIWLLIATSLNAFMLIYN